MSYLSRVPSVDASGKRRIDRIEINLRRWPPGGHESN
jgi:hypothetical protein